MNISTSRIHSIHPLSSVDITPIHDAPRDPGEGDPDENRDAVIINEGNVTVEMRNESTPRKRLNMVQRLEKKLNADIGFAWWNKYIAAAFWSNVSLPLNLTVTLLTALTTAQTTTDNLMPRDSYVALSILTLVISVLNTFFRPHAQMMDSIKLMSKWTEFGNKFETILYSENGNHKTRLREYQLLQNEINMFENSQSPESRNFLTDMIHVILRATWLKKRDKWVDIMDDAEALRDSS